MKSKRTSGRRSAIIMPAIALTLFFATNFLSGQSWYDTDWIYRSPVTVSNPAGVDLSDYQVKVTLTGGVAGDFDFRLAAAGGADIRITDADSTTGLPFVIEEWDATGGTAVIWTKVPLVPVAGTTIFVYYGFQGTPVAAGYIYDDIFDFYDGFDYEGDGGAATIPDETKWQRINGSEGNTIVDDGLLTLTTGSPYTRLNSRTSFPLNYEGGSTGYICETYARHPNQGTNGSIFEVGLVAGTDFLQGMRILDDFPDIVHWQYNPQNGDASSVFSMSAQADDDWHLFRIYREESPLTAGFQVDDYTVENTTDVTTFNVPVMLMSYGSGNISVYDWTRVRKWAGADPVPVVNTRETLSALKEWTGAVSSDWGNTYNWSSGVPSSTDTVLIQKAVNNPEIPSAQSCASIIIEPEGCLTITASGSLSVSGSIVINSFGTATSGSLINLGTVTGTVQYNRYLRPEDNMGERHFISSPVGGMLLADFFTVNSNIGQLWEYDEVAGWWPEVTSETLASGKGYNLSQTAGSEGRVSFIGSSVNDVDFIATSPYATGYSDRSDTDAYNVDALWVTGRSWDDYGGGGWNLMGNPFASALDAAEFVTVNTGKFDPYYEAIYVYDALTDVYRYATSTETGWEPDYQEGGSMGQYVQAGQGFYVLALYDNITFEFTPAMQAHQTAVPMLKSSFDGQRWPGLKLIATKDGKESSTLVIYNSEMTAGNDPGYDLGMMAGSSDLNLYTKIAKGDIAFNFARQALPTGGADTIAVAVGIDTENGGEITFSAETEPLGTNKFWLGDKVTGTYTDLTTKSYTITLPPKTYGTGRFFIIASTNTPTDIRLPEDEDSRLRIWNAGGKVIIQGETGEMATCEIFDLQGTKILSCNLDGGEINSVNLPSGIHGIIFVRINDGPRVITRKVAIL